MWKWVTSIIGRTFEQRIVRLLLLLVISYITLLIYGYRKRVEGFHQEQGSFIIKRDHERYDMYYANLYDKIYEPIVSARQIVEFLSSFTKPSPQSSILLDVGCGTGEFMNYAQTHGYENIFGIESSQDMIDYAHTKYPTLRIKHGNVIQPMNYDGSTFTHILCTGTHNVLYHLSLDMKRTFLSNCYHWLMPNNGYLILQLYDRTEFNPIPPCGTSSIVTNPQEHSDVRITHTDVKFNDFQYKSEYDFNTSKTCVNVTESFIDNQRNVRRNEFELILDDIDTILRMAKQIGFVIRGQTDMEIDNGQHLYLLEKINRL